MKNLRYIPLLACCATLILSGCKKDDSVTPSPANDATVITDADEVMDSSAFKVYMSTIGDDANDGLASEAPVKTLGRVQEILYASAPTTDVEVHIYQGTYYDQGVKWTFTNGRKITFTPIDFTTPRPVFDGQGRERWFWLHAEAGQNTNLYFRYLWVKNYNMAVWLDGDRDDEQNGWNGNNHFYRLYFSRIGHKYSDGDQMGYAVIDFVNSRNNVVTGCKIWDVENLYEEEFAHLHAFYISDYSTHNRITWNTVENVCGDPVRTRNESNWNEIEHNVFKHAGKYAFYSDWYCCEELAGSPCTRVGGECPSYGNEFRDNDCDKNYWGVKPHLFELFGDDSYCGSLPEARLRTSGNVNH